MWLGVALRYDLEYNRTTSYSPKRRILCAQSFKFPPHVLAAFHPQRHFNLHPLVTRLFSGPDADNFPTVYNRAGIAHQLPDLLVQRLVRL